MLFINKFINIELITDIEKILIEETENGVPIFIDFKCNFASTTFVEFFNINIYNLSQEIIDKIIRKTKIINLEFGYKDGKIKNSKKLECSILNASTYKKGADLVTSIYCGGKILDNKFTKTYKRGVLLATVLLDVANKFGISFSLNTNIALEKKSLIFNHNLLNTLDKLSKSFETKIIYEDNIIKVIDGDINTQRNKLDAESGLLTANVTAGGVNCKTLFNPLINLGNIVDIDLSLATSSGIPMKTILPLSGNYEIIKISIEFDNYANNNAMTLEGIKK